MSDIMHGRFARTIVQYSLGIGKSDLLSIRSTTLAVPLIREIYQEALRAGANVITRLSYDGEEEIFLREASSDQLMHIPESTLTEANTLTRRLFISAPFNTRSGITLSSELHAVRSKSLAEIGSIHTRRSLSGELRWCSTLFPTNALAQEAGMSLSEYEDFVYSAMFLDHADPIAAWKAFSMDQQSKVDYLDGVSTLRIVAKGTDITMQVAGRKWINSDGKRNFPSGEVFTGPIENTVEGTILFSFPSIRGGKEIANAMLTFEGGKVIEAHATAGEEYLLKELDTDFGARFVGEVAIGNNYGIQQYTRNTLFDEKIGGTCHMALGSSYPETGGLNQSSIHWDLVCDLRQGGEIIADGKIIHKNGQWTI